MLSLVGARHKERIINQLKGYTMFHQEHNYGAGPFVAFAYPIRNCLQDPFTHYLNTHVIRLGDEYTGLSEGTLLFNNLFTTLNQARESLDQPDKMRFKIEYLSFLDKEQPFHEDGHSGVLFVSVGAHLDDSIKYWDGPNARNELDHWGCSVLEEGLKMKLKPIFGISNYNFAALKRTPKGVPFSDSTLDNLLSLLEPGVNAQQ